jgi:hypothetical protein
MGSSVALAPEEMVEIGGPRGSRIFVVSDKDGCGVARIVLLTLLRLSTSGSNLWQVTAEGGAVS